jgi:tRNA(Arg) A34 adenosine deaminase TadA
LKKEIIKLVKEASKHDGEYKIAACLFKGGNILNIATNTKQYIGYRRDKFKFEPTRHAEINCIHNIARDLISSSCMLVLRTNAYDKLTCAKPCKSCISILKEVGIKKLYYSDYSGKLIKINPILVDLDNWIKDKPTKEYISDTINLKNKLRRKH